MQIGQALSKSLRQTFGQLLARIGVMVGARHAPDADAVRSEVGQFCDSRAIDRWIENLGATSGAGRAVDELVSLGEPALRRLLEVYDNKVSVPRGCSDRHASIGRNRAFTRLAERYPGVVLEYCRVRNYLNPSLSLLLRTSGDERLEALAAVAAKQFGWIKLPEIGSPSSAATQTEPQVAVDCDEIDRAIEQLGSGTPEGIVEAINKVVSLGEPALRRLLELHYCDAKIPVGRYWKDASDGRFNALARLTRMYPELALALVRGRPFMPTEVMAAFRQWGDERLKAIADIASHNNMRVPGLTSESTTKPATPSQE